MPQGTVKSFDPTRHTAVLMDDSLRVLPVDREAFAASGLLELRIGQRVRFEVQGEEGDERVTHLNLVTF